MLKLFGKEIDLDRFTRTPLKGKIPEKASGDDTEFFARSAKDWGVKDSGVKKYTFSVDFNGISYPFEFYVLTGRNGYT